VIRASAGTGKTFQLSSRYIALLAAGVAPDEILATTFTRKAAGEIQDRVLLRLADAAADADCCRELAASIGDKGFSQARARELLGATVRALDRLRIGTLDSHFLQIASGFGLELGLPPGWSICDEIVEQALREEAIELALSRGRLSELMTLVNLLAKGEAVRSISRLVESTVTQLFGYYRQAEAVAWEQIQLTKGLTIEELESVLECIAQATMPESRWTKTRDTDVANARSADWKTFISKGLALKVADGEVEFYKKPIPAELVAHYKKLLAHAASVLVGQLADQTRATQKLLAHFAREYADLQTQRRALRFDDVTHKLAAAAGAGAQERFAFRLDGRIRHLLLDEFQDTAPTQWQVLRPLAQAITHSAGDGQAASSFFCVGDTKQAIYGWRGGEAEIFDALGVELQNLEGQTLATSFRSSQSVIDAVNQVFQNLTSHPQLDKLHDAVQAWQSQFPPHTTAKCELPGFVRLEFAPTAEDDEDQTAAVCEFAAQAVARYVADSPHSSIGVLVRTNKAVARMIYLLRRRGVPASEEGGNPLIDSPAVEVILSLLRLADHPGDDVARFHLAHSPLAAALELADYRDRRTAEQLARLTRRQLLDEGYGPLVFAWARRLAEHCDERDQSRLQQLVELAYEYQPASTLRTDDFIRLVEQRRIADPTTANVRVMTIHQAKGLEFDIVVLPELHCPLVGQPESVVVGRPRPTEPIDVVCRYAAEEVRKFLPPRLVALFDDDRRRTVAESLCVLYVAMTRAVHCLHMILPPPKSNERSLPKTYAGLLRATLGQGLASTAGVVYEHGDAQWFTRLLARPAAHDPSRGRPLWRSDDLLEHSPVELPSAQIHLAPPLPAPARGLERVSPSSLEGGHKFPAGKLLEDRPTAGFDHGTLVHAWMEQVAWLDDGLPADASLLAIAARVAPGIAANRADCLARLATLRKQLQQPKIAAALFRAAYNHYAGSGQIHLEVLRERPFALRVGDRLLSGSIDRLVLIHRGGKLIAAEVLDYKTDALPPGDKAALAAKVEFYRPQMEAYRLAVATVYGLREQAIGLSLLFLHRGEVCQIK
jgi:ATP-dependent exoDNAse (exonuclease V) beta subunit